MKPSQKINKSAPSERQEQAETEKLCSLLPINDTLSKLQDQTETKNGWKQQVSPSKWMRKEVWREQKLREKCGNPYLPATLVLGAY